MLRHTQRFIFGLLFLSLSSVASADITVLAAASLTNALGDIIKNYEAKQHLKITTSFASSSVLAKQIENGIPADLFIAADEKWMDYLQEKSKIDSTTRRNLVGNSLVLIAPKAHSFSVKLEKGGNLAGAFEGKLCTGETETIPVGKYAKQALQNLAVWDAIKPRLVGTEDVRAALAFVERDECTAGIVYATDAQASDKVTVVGTFPEASHAPIVYPIALLSQSAEAKAFLEYLTQDEERAVFEKYGFKRLD